MIEKIGTKYYEKLSQPNNAVIELLHILKRQQSNLTICEIGVGIGATTLAICDNLSAGDELYLFDYEDSLHELTKDLNSRISHKINVIPCGNSRKQYDSYAWSLASLAEKEYSLFDIVFLDGAHDFTIDYVAISLLKTLIKDNGVIIIDDLELSFNDICFHNSLQTEKYNERYSLEQMETPHMKKLINLLLEHDPDFKKISISDFDSNFAIYQKSK